MHGSNKRGSRKRRAIGSEPSTPARRNGIRLLEATVYPDGRIVYRAENPNEVQQLLELAGGIREGTPARYTPPSVAPHPIPAAVTLSEAIRRYQAHRATIVARGGANPQTEAERVLTLQEFRTWHEAWNASLQRAVRKSRSGQDPNDLPVSAIGFTTINAYVEHLLHERKLSIKTMQKKGSNLHLFFEFLRKVGLFPQEHALPTEGQFKVSLHERSHMQKANARVVFTTEELQRIFDPANLEPDSQHPMRPHQLWFPLIGLFTGARNTEICDLCVEHFSMQGDIPAMFLPGTKTDNAPRHVPIHTKLLELGLWEYVEQVKAAGFTLLFPYLTISKKGSRAKVPTDNFHALLENLGIKTPHKVFYSFRHGIIEQMTGAKGVHPDWSRDYTGHWPQDIHKRQYGMPAFVEVQKREVTDKIEFDDVNLGLLKRYKDRDWKLAELVSAFAGRRSAYHETLERNRPAAERAAAKRAQREARRAELLQRRRPGV